jgi:hypothetical protein
VHAPQAGAGANGSSGVPLPTTAAPSLMAASLSSLASAAAASSGFAAAANATQAALGPLPPAQPLLDHLAATAAALTALQPNASAVGAALAAFAAASSASSYAALLAAARAAQAGPLAAALALPAAPAALSAYASASLSARGAASPGFRDTLARLSGNASALGGAWAALQGYAGPLAQLAATLPPAPALPSTVLAPLQSSVAVVVEAVASGLQASAPRPGPPSSRMCST